MAVNPNIALSFRPTVGLESPGNMMAQAAQIRGLEGQNRMRAMQLEAAQQEQLRENALLPYRQADLAAQTEGRNALARKSNEETAARAVKTLRDMLPATTAETFPQWQAAAVQALPQFAELFAGEYSPERVRGLMQTADQFLAQQAERNKIQAVAPNSTMIRDGQVIGQAAPAPQRAFSVRGGVYDPERGFMAAPGAAAGGGVSRAAVAAPAGGAAEYTRGPLAGFRRAADGSLEPIPGGPKDPASRPGGAAGGVAVARREEGRETLRAEVQGLLDSYSALNDLGAMVNPGRGVRANVSARTRASGIGQLAGSFAGTPEQTLRDNINNARARLTNAIKEATGMSAQQMNSNVELQLWLRAATDPTQSYDTVVKTLGDLETILTRAQAPRDTKPGAPARALSPQDEQALQWAQSNPNDPRAAEIRRRLGR